MSLAKNTKLKVGDAGGSEVFTQIANVTSITWSGRNWAEEDVTNHDSSTPVKTTTTTIYDNGKISLVISPWDPTNTQHVLLKTLSASGAARNFELVQVASASDDHFSGFVTAFAFETPVGGVLKAKVDVKINGAFS